MTETNSDTQQGRRRRRRGRRRSGAVNKNQLIPLFKRSLAHFQPGDRQRGADYLSEQRVRLRVDGTRARALVEGTEQDSYAVGLDWSQVPSDRVLHAFCECPRFAKGRPCKHIWATLLAVNDGAPNSQPGGKGRLRLAKDAPGDWRDLGFPADAPRTTPPRPPVHDRPPRPQPRKRGARGKASGPSTSWRAKLDTLAKTLRSPKARPAAKPDNRVYRFLVNTRMSATASALVLEVFSRPAEGVSGDLQRSSLEPSALEPYLRIGDAEDGEMPRPLALVTTFAAPPRGRGPRGRVTPVTGAANQLQRFAVPPSLFESVLPKLGEDGALGSWDGRTRARMQRLTFDDGLPWHVASRLDVNAAGGARVRGVLARGTESMLLDAPVLFLPADHEAGTPGLVLADDTLAWLDADQSDVAWIEHLRKVGDIDIPNDDLEEGLNAYLSLEGRPPLETGEGRQLSEEQSPPVPRLLLAPDPASILPEPPLLATLSFDYGSVQVPAGDPRAVIIARDEGSYLRRDMDAEHHALVRLLEAGVQPIAAGQEGGHGLELAPRELPAVAEPLLADGWEVEIRGTTLRAPSPPSLKVESGIDWFEVTGSTDFDGDPVELKEILAAISRGDRFVSLTDGSKGLLPAAWMETYGSLAELAHDEGDEGLRFLPAQALLVDALLTAMPPANVDEAFSRLRDKLRSFDRIKPKKEPRGFQGTLRTYQRQGLGWLEFLREFGLGGVLADDMGLGKTVQVLALVRANRTPTKTTGLPFLVVAPRSLVYNWIEEAARFTPTMRSVEYRGPDREALQSKIGRFDIVVTTYETLRRDINFLATVEFDTVILDEAQAIKNRDSQAAKACRVLVARNRLALTGTPIENHLGELGSLFEFLNPGLLGKLPALDVLGSGRTASRTELKVVAEGIRPFILRRTKSQVLDDLPPKTEQVLYCTLHPDQRELYDKVRAGYQASLLGDVEKKGVAGSAIQVLEALLRLRQIACHPGLVQDEWQETGSAKLDTLFEQITEILDEGHKVLVFSQFTQLLALVRERLDTRDVRYAYLDGQTRKRAEVVERFQTDPDCSLFLISLKAGGVGLNLTAAGYVFLLDPWWNPAVEAQAIDRAHRIGQTQPVFSYRLIARDTVEEKILELQRSKRELADAVLEGEGMPVSQLTADDLRTLLS